MTAQPKLQLSRLREIGWSKWNPIGIGEPEDDRVADEYDTYLLQAAGQLWNGRSDEEVASYLVKIETDHMGLSAAPGVAARALDVVKAIREYIETLRT